MATNKTKGVSARASDLGDLLLSGSTGFAVRKKTGVGVIIHFFLLACMVVLGASLLVYYNSPEGSALVIVIGAVFALVSKNLEKMKKVKQSLEFMNALFSSALSKGYQFCFIVKGTGDIIFFNRPFQALFPAFMAQSDRKIDALFTAYNVPQDQRDQVAAIINAGSEGALSLSFQETGAAAPATLHVELEIIDRPTGFFLVRGK